MKQPLRVLHLEDNPFDAELIQRMLSAEGIKCDIVRVETQEQFSAELAKADYDIVLADYALPSFNGMTALAITRQNRQDIPFILISGTVGEEVAVEALKSGATDYIIKQRISRLPFAVRRALQETRERADRKHAEEQRYAAEVKYRNLVEKLPGIVYIAEFGVKGKWLYVSPPVESILGYTPAEIMETAGAWYQLMHPEDRERVLNVETESLRTGDQFVSEYRMHARDGSIVWLRDEGSVLHDPPLIQGVMLDITRAKKAEEEKEILEKQYRQVQKMEAIGRLAGGVAHDFNNLLMAVSGYCELMQLRLTPTEDHLNEPIKEIQKTIEQGARLTKQLLAFSRNQIQEMRMLDLNEIIRNMEKMLQSLLREDIQLRTELEEPLWPVKADQGQIEQVVMNLVVNARDAMQQGGKLTIRTYNTEKDTRFENGFVTLAVIDSGSGMHPDTLAHIFEPFFTTKEKAGGSGLGLATVYGIVKQSGGEIQVSSELGSGTTFLIAMPRPKEEAMADQTFPLSSEKKREVEYQTILFVDDCEDVRRPLSQLLERKGYKVLQFFDGKEALDAARQHKGPIHLLITDILMPQMNGLELAIRVKTMLPELKVLFVTGLSTETARATWQLESDAAVIQKPASFAMLLQKIQELLG